MSQSSILCDTLRPESRKNTLIFQYVDDKYAEKTNKYAKSIYFINILL